LALLFADENLPNPTVKALRRLGHDVVTVAEVDLAGLGIPGFQPDLQVRRSRGGYTGHMPGHDWLARHAPAGRSTPYWSQPQWSSSRRVSKFFKRPILNPINDLGDAIRQIAMLRAAHSYEDIV
jgi:hypothetical protein